MKDLRSALRGYAGQPGFVAVAVISVAIGIGANTALFSLVNPVLLRPIPGIEEPDRVVELNAVTPTRGFASFTYPDFLDLRAAELLVEHLYRVEYRADEHERRRCGHSAWCCQE
jgi:hypothetical protein